MLAACFVLYYRDPEHTVRQRLNSVSAQLHVTTLTQVPRFQKMDRLPAFSKNPLPWETSRPTLDEQARDAGQRR